MCVHPVQTPIHLHIKQYFILKENSDIDYPKVYIVCARYSAIVWGDKLICKFTTNACLSRIY